MIRGILRDILIIFVLTPLALIVGGMLNTKHNIIPTPIQKPPTIRQNQNICRRTYSPSKAILVSNVKLSNYCSKTTQTRFQSFTEPN
jgi:hypothetical protein